MYKRILVPLDGSKLAESALPYAQELAAAFDSEIILQGVLKSNEAKLGQILEDYLKQKVKDVESQLTLKRGKSGSEKSAAGFVVSHGMPAVKIIEYTDHHDIDLVIITTHARSGFKRWAIGSVAEKVFQGVKTSVLLTRIASEKNQSPETKLFQRIIVALDKLETSEVILPHTQAIATKFDSTVTCLHVVAGGIHIHTIGGLDYIKLPEQEVKSAQNKADQYLAEISSKLDLPKNNVDYKVQVGEEADEIVKAADETRASLVILGTCKHSGSRRWAYGSIIHKVLHSGKTPLLLARSTK